MELLEILEILGILGILGILEILGISSISGDLYAGLKQPTALQLAELNIYLNAYIHNQQGPTRFGSIFGASLFGCWDLGSFVIFW